MQKNQGKARDEQTEFQFLHNFLPEAPKEWAGRLYEKEESLAEGETVEQSTLTFDGLQTLEKLPTR